MLQKYRCVVFVFLLFIFIADWERFCVMLTNCQSRDLQVVVVVVVVTSVAVVVVAPCPIICSTKAIFGSRKNVSFLLLCSSPLITSQFFAS